MADVNKVEIGGETLIDLTSDTVAADKMQKGITAHSASGETVEGVLEKVQYMTQAEFDAAEAAGTLDPDGYYSTPDDEQTTTATTNKVGVMKLYESLGDATDGTMTQAAIKAAVEAGGGVNIITGCYTGDSKDAASVQFVDLGVPVEAVMVSVGHIASTQRREAYADIATKECGVFWNATSNNKTLEVSGTGFNAYNGNTQTLSAKNVSGMVYNYIAICSGNEVQT